MEDFVSMVRGSAEERAFSASDLNRGEGDDEDDPRIRIGRLPCCLGGIVASLDVSQSREHSRLVLTVKEQRRFQWLVSWWT